MYKDEYIMICISMIPQEFVDKYNLTEKSYTGYIYARVTKGIYVLPQAGRVEYDALVKYLESYGYHLSRKTLDYGKQNSTNKLYVGSWWF